jgi:hypothetical protein
MTTQEAQKIFPCLLWVLRDFTLQLVNSSGFKISSKSYLDEALNDAKGVGDNIREKNRIRKLLREFFPERECQTLVRPCQEESVLQDLANASDAQLRREFLTGLDELRDKISAMARYKTVQGTRVNGPMLL